MLISADLVTAPYVLLNVHLMNSTVTQVHNLYDEETLARSFNTLELLMADERVQRAVAYNAKQHTRTKEDSLNPLIRYRK